MSYYENEKNIRDYIKMAEGYNGKALIESLKKYLPSGKTVLELGMGPGVDLNLLREEYVVTGSDYSNSFVALYQSKHPDEDVLVLDAITIDTGRKYDCIYSNKVLYHLSKEELAQSINRQYEVLNENGVILHSFWEGDREEFFHGLKFMYYQLSDLTKLFETRFDILLIEPYTEMSKDDSIYLIARKR